MERLHRRGADPALVPAGVRRAPPRRSPPSWKATPADAYWEEFGPGAVGTGWDLTVMGLALHLEGTGHVDPTATQAWTVSADGRRFMAESSAAWQAADIADGSEPESARGAAARTLAAYTEA